MADDPATLQARLAALRAYRDKLLLGQGLEEIRHGQNEVMRFSKPPSLSDIDMEIAKIEVALGLRTSVRVRARRVAF